MRVVYAGEMPRLVIETADHNGTIGTVMYMRLQGLSGDQEWRSVFDDGGDNAFWVVGEKDNPNPEKLDEIWEEASRKSDCRPLIECYTLLMESAIKVSEKTTDPNSHVDAQWMIEELLKEAEKVLAEILGHFLLNR